MSFSLPKFGILSSVNLIALSWSSMELLLLVYLSLVDFRQDFSFLRESCWFFLMIDAFDLLNLFNSSFCKNVEKMWKKWDANFSLVSFAHAHTKFHKPGPTCSKLTARWVKWTDGNFWCHHKREHNYWHQPMLIKCFSREGSSPI